MCRLVIWDLDRPAAKEPALEAGRYQRGMVVSILEDKQEPGVDVYKLGWWRIVDVPGVPRGDLEYLTYPQPADVDKSKLPRKRWNVIDAASIEASADTVIVSGEGNVKTTENTKPSVEAATATVAYVQDTAQIGPDPQVIG